MVKILYRLVIIMTSRTTITANEARSKTQIIIDENRRNRIPNNDIEIIDQLILKAIDNEQTRIPIFNNGFYPYVVDKVRLVDIIQYYTRMGYSCYRVGFWRRWYVCWKYS